LRGGGQRANDVRKPHGDDDVSTQGSGRTSRDLIHDTAIDEKPTAYQLRWKGTWDRHAGHDCASQRSFDELHLLATNKIRRGRYEWNRQLFDQPLA